MSYVNAEDVLPENLLTEIQKYADGKVLYAPRKKGSSLSWGEKSGSRDRLAKRNLEIVGGYLSGRTVEELSAAYFLSVKRIRGIIRENRSSNGKG